jgi:glucose/mannose-6-phosphate isomerase
MYELIQKFPSQMHEALKLSERFPVKPMNERIENVLVSGLGGSGIGGNLVKELVESQLKVPFVVNKSYFLPAFTGQNTLLILSSYSGNTEETINVARQAYNKGLNPYCVTSGGKLGELAQASASDLIVLPSGFPPRTCLGFSSIQLLYLLNKNGVIGDEYSDQIKRAADFIEQSQQQIMSDAESMAEQLKGRVVILYAEDRIESTAIRLKQQINENSKMHCWYNVIPEMNHNELVGWREQSDQLAVVFMRYDDEFERNVHRIRFKQEVINQVTNCVLEINAKGEDAYQRLFYLIHFGDWLSFYLAVKLGYDPMEIDVLNELKNKLSAIPHQGEI